MFATRMLVAGQIFEHAVFNYQSGPRVNHKLVCRINKVDEFGVFFRVWNYETQNWEREPRFRPRSIFDDAVGRWLNRDESRELGVINLISD